MSTMFCVICLQVIKYQFEDPIPLEVLLAAYCPGCEEDEDKRLEEIRATWRHEVAKWRDRRMT